MKATDILMSEHRVIERVIDSLQVATRQLDSGAAVRPGFFLDAADFIKGFADGCHHQKEEGVLFKAMTASGMPVQGVPIGVMLHEHELGRTYTQAMREAALKLAAGDESARPAVIAAARSDADLLRQHIAKEDSVLFPMAEQVIPIDQHENLLEDFEHVEHEETGEGVHERYLTLAERLEQEMRSLL